MRTGNTRNLAIILVVLIVIVIINSVILFQFMNKSNITQSINEPFEKVPKPITKAINSDEKIIFKSSNEKITDYAIYAFSVFCIFLVILSTVRTNYKE